MKSGVIIALACTFMLGGCLSDGKAPADAIAPAELDAAIAAEVDPASLRLSASGLPSIDDPVARLGRALFFARSLSGDGDVACVSCHHPQLAGADGLSLSVGVHSTDPFHLGPGRRLFANPDLDPVAGDGPNVPRNAPTTFNSAFYSRAMFHDGRLFVLDETRRLNGGGQLMRSPDSFQNLPDPEAVPNLMAAQARFPVTSLFEMRGYGPFVSLSNQAVRTKIEERLQASAGWLTAFRAAFGMPAAAAGDVITYRNIGLALGEYQRSQVFVDSAWQRYVRGDVEALTESAKRGAVLFFRSREEGGAGCSACHAGAHFTDEEFHVAGFPQLGRGKNTAQQDFGRREVTQSNADRYRFRVPSLLNVARTGPYGHSGSFRTLEEVVRYHVDPVEGAAAFDYTLQHLPQFQGLTVRYPNIRSNTQLAVDAFMQSDSKALLYAPGMPAAEIRYLVDFLESLTDSCLDDAACLSPWIATPEVDNADGTLLVACFSAEVVAGLPCSGSGGGGGGGGGPVVEPVANDPELARAPLVQQAVAAARQGCPNGMATAANSGALAFAAVAPDVSGLSHTHRFDLDSWLSLRNRIEEFVVSGSLAVGDFNGDCWEDVAFAGGDAGSITYTGGPGGRFSFFHNDGLRDHSVAIGDLNGDYRPEIIAGGYLEPEADTRVRIYQNNWPDFALVTGSQAGVSVRRSMGSITIADYNLDGWPDLYLGLWTLLFNAPPDKHLWKGLGDLKFHGLNPPLLTNATDFTFSPAVADINSDARPDLLMAGDFENSQVYLQSESGTFAKITDRAVISDENGMGSAVADFDNDGDLDWFVSSISTSLPPLGNWGMSGNRFYRNPGNGHFTDDTSDAGVRHGGWGWGSCAADFDNDGDLDIYQANGFGFPDDVWRALFPFMPAQPSFEFLTQPSRLFINDGSGRFADQAVSWQVDDRGQGRGVSCLDADRDGDVDLLIANNSQQPSYYLNQSGAGVGRRFLTVRLVGVAPNTEALGARIYVTAGGRTQMREVANGTNYLSNNPLEQHFGLADASVVAVRVVWPRTGVETVLEGVAANQFLVVAEP